MITLTQPLLLTAGSFSYGFAMAAEAPKEKFETDVPSYQKVLKLFDTGEPWQIV